MRYRFLLAFVTFLVVGVVAGGSGLTQTQATVSIETESVDPGVFTTHTVAVVIDENTTGDVTGLRVDYGDSGVDTGTVSRNRVEEFGIDRDGDEPGDEVDADLEDDITDIDSLDDGRVLSIEVQGGRLARVGDEVVLSYRITNPAEAGTYPVTVTYNPDDVAAIGTATLQIGEPATAQPTAVPTAQPTASPTATAEPTPTETSSPTPAVTETPSPTAEPTPEPTPTPTSVPSEPTRTTSPGVGVVAGVLALVAAAVLLTRRLH